MEVVEDTPMGQWDPATLARHLRLALPKLKKKTGREDALKDKVAENVQSKCVTGLQLMMEIIESSKPGAIPFRQSELGRAVFGGTEEDFKEAQTAIRGVDDFIASLVRMLAFSHSSTTITGAQRKIFGPDLVPFDRRLPSCDAFYGVDAEWCIKCGNDALVPYESDRFYGSSRGIPGGGKGMHGSYICPSGWTRFALNAVHDCWDTWHKAYHGTAASNIRAIVDIGLKVGDGQHGGAGAGGKKVVYCTPSIEYAAHYVYTNDQTEANQIRQAEDSGLGEEEWSLLQSAGFAGEEGKFAQYVFELRVKPGAYVAQGNTLSKSLWENWAIEYETRCSSRNLEWIVENPNENMVCTGVMIRELPCGPKEWNMRRLAQMKEHVQWDGTRATRPRDYGGVGPEEAAAWEYNDAPGNTLARGDDVPWVRYDPDRIAIIEQAYQDYQRFAYLGQPDGAPGPYVINFGELSDGSGPPIQHRADPDKAQDWRRRAVRRVPA